MNGDYLTVGWEREDGDLDVFATFNLQNLRDRADDEAAREIRRYLEELAHGIGAVVLERQDAPDIILGADDEERALLAIERDLGT